MAGAKKTGAGAPAKSGRRDSVAAGYAGLAGLALQPYVHPAIQRVTVQVTFGTAGLFRAVPV